MNAVVPYHRESVSVAIKLTRKDPDQLTKFRKITNYVSRHFVYDYVYATQIAKKKNVLPDIKRTWQEHMGVCQDIAAMTTGMLRAVGIDASMCVGKADGRRHAWVEAKISGKTYRYDHIWVAKEYITEKRY